jgi:hypothetical protein
VDWPSIKFSPGRSFCYDHVRRSHEPLRWYAPPISLCYLSRFDIDLSALPTVVKQRMQLQNSRYSSVSQAFRTVYKTEGISAFYVSYPTTIMMTVPFTAVQFTVRPSFSTQTPYSTPIRRLSSYRPNPPRSLGPLAFRNATRRPIESVC